MLFFNAWLTRNLGAEGMGLYGLMMTVYRFTVTFASAGAGLAATRLVAEEEARSDPQRQADAMRKAVEYALCFGAAAMLVNDDRATLPFFMVMAWSLPFVAVSGALSGWFTAVGRVASASAAMIFEQVSQMVFTVAVFAVLRPEIMARAGRACGGRMVSEAAAASVAFALAKAAAALTCSGAVSGIVLTAAIIFAAAVYYILLRLMGCIKPGDLELAVLGFRRQPL